MNDIKPWEAELPIQAATDDIISREEIDRIERLAREEFAAAIAVERDHQIRKHGSDVVTEKPVDIMLALLLRSVGEMAIAISISSNESSDKESLDEIYAAIASAGATVSALYEWYRVQLALDLITIEREQLTQPDPWMDMAEN